MPRVLPSFVAPPSEETRRAIVQRNRVRREAREAAQAAACVDRATASISSDRSESHDVQQEKRTRIRADDTTTKKRRVAEPDAKVDESEENDDDLDELELSEEEEEINEAVRDELNRSGRRDDSDEMDDFLDDDDQEEEEEEEEYVPMRDSDSDSDSDNEDDGNIYGNEKAPKAAGVDVASLREDLTVTLGQRKVSVVQGDVSNLSVDALVHPTDAFLSLHGAVGRALSAQAASSGADLLRILSCRQTQLSTSAACLTRCTRIKGLPCKSLVHVHSPNYRKASDPDKALTEVVVSPSCHPAATLLLPQAVLSVLEQADKAKAVTVALPSIGTGANRYPLHEAVMSRLHKFLRTVSMYVTALLWWTGTGHGARCQGIL
ncbi:MAG: hypothetical protein MHM6MM_000236 [Cercozoa sp. M6MM]